MKVIYGLFDPEDGQLRYIGETKRKLYLRKRDHVCQARNYEQTSMVSSWIRDLLSRDLRPEIGEIDASSHPEDEEWWIAYFQSIGCDLLNHWKNPRNRGKHKKWNHSATTRHKISKTKAEWWAKQ